MYVPTQKNGSVETEQGLQFAQNPGEITKAADIGQIISEPLEVLAGSIGNVPTSSIDLKVELPTFLPEALKGNVDVTVPPVVSMLIGGSVLVYALRRVLSTRNRANIGYHSRSRHTTHSRDKY